MIFIPWYNWKPARLVLVEKFGRNLTGEFLQWPVFLNVQQRNPSKNQPGTNPTALGTADSEI